LAILTFHYAIRADINVGVISTVWAINPLFLAVLDFLIYKQQLTKKHLLGMISLVLCAVCISLSRVVQPDTAHGSIKIYEESERVPAWIPTLFSVITPIGFAISGMLVKWLVRYRGMHPSYLSFGSYTIINFLLTVGAIIFFCVHGISWKLFFIGFVGSVINTLGIVSAVHAVSNGPAGPASALMNSSNILLAIVEAIRFMTMPRSLEIVGMIIGLFGATVLTIPDQLK